MCAIECLQFFPLSWQTVIVALVMEILEPTAQTW